MAHGHICGMQGLIRSYSDKTFLRPGHTLFSPNANKIDVFNIN